MVKNGIIMHATISKWGNSQGIRLPKKVLELLQLKENEDVEISVNENEMIIRKKKEFRNLKERLEAFYERPLSEISMIESEEEVDFGTPKGEEFW